MAKPNKDDWSRTKFEGENLQQLAIDLGKGLIGETPSEIALTAALGPVGKIPRAAMLGASAMTRSGDAEAVLARLGAQVPARLQKMFTTAKKLRDEGRLKEIYQETGGELVGSPAGHIEAIYRPQLIDKTRITQEGKPFYDVVNSPIMKEELPELSNTLVRKEIIDRNVFGSFGQRYGEPGVITLNRIRPEDFSKALGHETTHAVDKAAGRTFGSSKEEAEAEIQAAIKAIKGEFPQLAQVSRKRADELIEHLRNPRRPYDLYARNIGEMRARGGGSVWQNPKQRNVSPYDTGDVMFPIEGKILSPYNVKQLARERVMSPVSPVFHGDLRKLLQELRTGQ